MDLAPLADATLMDARMSNGSIQCLFQGHVMGQGQVTWVPLQAKIHKHAKSATQRVDESDGMVALLLQPLRLRMARCAVVPNSS